MAENAGASLTEGGLLTERPLWALTQNARAWQTALLGALLPLDRGGLLGTLGTLSLQAFVR